MILNNLHVSHFRCHRDDQTWTISPELTLIVGPNAKGKTSLLEAMYMLSRGKGFREDDELELLTFGDVHGYVSGQYQGESGQLHEAAVVYQRVSDALEKKYLLDKAATSITKFRRVQTPSVLFAPHLLDIITHSPSHRREYLDQVISRVDPIYAKYTNEYTAALRKRNAILESYVDEQELRVQLDFWDEYLSVRAQSIIEKRQAYIDILHTQIHCGGYTFKVIYQPNHLTRGLLQEKYPTEKVARRTLIGPQKDSIEFLISQGDDVTSFRNVHAFGSRSQQRLALLWLKLHEIDFLQSRLAVKPILLLDDVFSEFDERNKQLIFSLLPAYQTVMTSTEEDIEDRYMKTALRIQMD